MKESQPVTTLRSPMVYFVTSYLFVVPMSVWVFFSDDYGEMAWPAEAVTWMLVALVLIAFRQRVTIAEDRLTDVRWFRSRSFLRAEVVDVELVHVSGGLANPGHKIDIHLASGETVRLVALAGYYVGNDDARIARQFRVIRDWVRGEPIG